jgi:quercetin dioxygenase-like cupin family protein
MKKLIRLVPVLLIFLISIKAEAQQNQVVRKNLLTTMINQKVFVVDIKEVTLAEGQVVPKHLHPCPVVGYIKSGTVIFQIEGEDQVILKEGDAFYEPRNKNILHFDNASKDKPLTFAAFYLKEEAKQEIIKMLDK